MRRIITIALVLCLTVTPCKALTVFQADYDGDSYTTETVYEGEDWLPLRELAEILPYTVEWNEAERTVFIHAQRTHTIRPDWWLPPGVQIKNGVTYVTPKYLNGILGGQAFFYDGELYVYGGETERSWLVRGSETFRANALTVMYRLRLSLPEDYRLIRRNLTGGMEETMLPAWAPYSTRAFVYPNKARPTAYIVAHCSGASLAELIAHEAYHVHLTRRGRNSEEAALEYGRRVAELLLIN